MEINESELAKENTAKDDIYPDRHWVFGGIESGTNEAFTVEVADRSAATLLPIIRQHIKPGGTTVISDEWRVCSRINVGMTHETVNHFSINFVDPVSGSHTHNSQDHVVAKIFWEVIFVICFKAAAKNVGLSRLAVNITRRCKAFNKSINNNAQLKMHQ